MKRKTNEEVRWNCEASYSQNVRIGEGNPKIVVPIVAPTAEDILAKQRQPNTRLDLVEWRLDYYENVADFSDVCNLSQQVMERLGQNRYC